MNSKFTIVFKLFEKSKKDKIAIIGKGSSIDDIDFSTLADFFVINLNDSEKIYPGSLGLYYYSWVNDFINSEGGACDLYITCRDLKNNKSIKVNHLHENPENISPIQSRFFENEFFLEDAIIISALKIANMIADNSRTKLPVYLLGFDFSIENGFSVHLGDNEDFLGKAYVDGIFNSQEEYLKLLMLYKSRLSIDVKHIGSKEISSSSVAEFNAYFNGGSRECKARVSDLVTHKNTHWKFKVKIVAEITTNHFGDLGLLKKMIAAAAGAGADYIKLQKRDVESFYSQAELAKPYKSTFGETFRDYRNGIELDDSGFECVEKWCKELEIKWFTSVLDIQSYYFIKKYSPSLIKLPSTISEHKDFLELVANDFKNDIVISTGMTDIDYEKWIIEKFNNCNNIYLLQCVSSYPTTNQDANVAVVRHYHDLSTINSKIIPGYSSHDVGSLCSQLSIAAGSLMVEKHVKYGNTPWAHFDNVAIDMLTDQFKGFVSDLRLAEICLGRDMKVVLDSEHHKYKISH